MLWREVRRPALFYSLPGVFGSAERLLAEKWLQQTVLFSLLQLFLFIKSKKIGGKT